MSNKNIEVVDLFDKEISKKEKKLLKKVEKAKLKEEKKLMKKKKLLDQQDEQGFNEYLEKIKREKLIETPTKIDEIKSIEHIEIKPVKEDVISELIKDEAEEVKSEKKHPFLNFLVILLSIILLVISSDYLLYNVYTNYIDLPTMINSILLVCMVIFYLLSIAIKSNGSKKFFQILSLLCIIAFMSYHLFIA